MDTRICIQHKNIIRFPTVCIDFGFTFFLHLSWNQWFYGIRGLHLCGLHIVFKMTIVFETIDHIENFIDTSEYFLIRRKNYKISNEKLLLSTIKEYIFPVFRVWVSEISGILLKNEQSDLADKQNHNFGDNECIATLYDATEVLDQRWHLLHDGPGKWGIRTTSSYVVSLKPTHPLKRSNDLRGNWYFIRIWRYSDDWMSSFSSSSNQKLSLIVAIKLNIYFKYETWK